ncbi:MAG: hypothetical protein ACI81V_001357 [Lentimonas sp.]|jgi:hypothetical protein
MRQQSGRTQPARRNEVLQPSKRTPAPTRPLGQWPSRDLETTVGTEPNPPVERGASAIEADASSNAAIGTVALPGSRDYSRDGDQPARRNEVLQPSKRTPAPTRPLGQWPSRDLETTVGTEPNPPVERGASAIEADASSNAAIATMALPGSRDYSRDGDQPARRNEVLQPSKRTPAPTRPLGQWPSRDLETTVGTEPNPPDETRCFSHRSGRQLQRGHCDNGPPGISRLQSGRNPTRPSNEVLQPSKRTPAPTRPLRQWPSRDLETTVGTETNPPVETRCFSHRSGRPTDTPRTALIRQKLIGARLEQRPTCFRRKRHIFRRDQRRFHDRGWFAHGASLGLHSPQNQTLGS